MRRIQKCQTSTMKRTARLKHRQVFQAWWTRSSSVIACPSLTWRPIFLSLHRPMSGRASTQNTCRDTVRWVIHKWDLNSNPTPISQMSFWKKRNSITTTLYKARYWPRIQDTYSKAIITRPRTLNHQLEGIRLSNKAPLEAGAITSNIGKNNKYSSIPKKLPTKVSDLSQMA